MRKLIIMFTAFALLLGSSCDSTTHRQPDELPRGESENITESDDNELQDIIDQSLDTLTENTTGLFTTEEIIAAHPEAFETIVSLGKMAIPLLEKYTNTDHEMTSKEAECCVIARAAAYAIDP